MAGQSQIPLYVPGDRGTIAQLLMAQGEAQARGAERSGQIWGNAVNQIGQLAGGAVQQYQEDKLLKRREAAIDSVMGSWDGQDAMQLYRGLAPIIGPEKAQHVAQGLAETRLAAEKLRRGEMPSREDTAGMIHTAGALEDAQPGYLSKPQNYSLFKQVAGPGVLAHFGYQLPDEPTPEVLQGIQTIYKQVLAQPKGAATKTVTVRQPDGSEVTKIVEDKPGQEFVSAPKPEPSLQQIQAEAEARARGTRMGAPPAASEAQEPLVAVMGPNGEPVLVRRSRAEGMKPASNREQGRAVTSGDAGRISDIDTSLSDLGVLDKELTGSKATGTSAKLGAAAPSWVTDLTGYGLEPKKKQAAIDRVKQVIGKALEGGVLRKEDEYKYEKILPTIGDTPELVKKKLAGLKSALADRRRIQLEALSDAGYDTSRFEARVAGSPKADPLGIR